VVAVLDLIGGQPNTLTRPSSRSWKQVAAGIASMGGGHCFSEFEIVDADVVLVLV
jgi:hypothetical protein